MHPVLVFIAVIAAGAACAWIGYYAGIGHEQKNTFKWVRRAHQARERANQLAAANLEMMAEVASLQAGETPLSPSEAMTLADIEFNEFGADQ